MKHWSTGESDSVLGAFMRAVQGSPNEIFLDVEGETFTYSESFDEACRFAHGLQDRGIGRGDVVLLMLSNGALPILLWLAGNMVGAVTTTINTDLRGDFLQHVVNDADPSLIIVETRYLERVLEVAQALSYTGVIVRTGPVSTDQGPRTVIALESLRMEGTAVGLVLEPNPRDLSCLVYTGGTTGRSKACAISHNYICHLARQILLVSARESGETMFNPLPVFHLNPAATTVVPSMLLKSTAAIGRGFSVSRFWPEIERSGARLTMLAGSMPALLAKMPDTLEMQRCYGQLRAMLGAPYPDHIELVCRERFGAKIVGLHGYGLTEASLVTLVPAGEPTKPGSAGRRCEDFDVRIFDDNDNELPPGAPGEIVFRPMKPHIMFEGYWKRPEATQAVSRNLWFHSGDIGAFDSDGYLYFMDRKKDYVRRRGENISSMEVEAIYLQHPELAEVAVHAVASDLGEDDVKVTAVLRQGDTISPKDLFEWSVKRIPYFALPRYIEFRTQLPTSELGRVWKHKLRDEGVHSEHLGSGGGGRRGRARVTARDRVWLSPDTAYLVWRLTWTVALALSRSERMFATSSRPYACHVHWWARRRTSARPTWRRASEVPPRESVGRLRHWRGSG